MNAPTALETVVTLIDRRALIRRSASDLPV
jgi:hypothetical protein